MAALQDEYTIYVCFYILPIAANFGNQLPASAFGGSIQLFIGRFREPGRASCAFPITKDTSGR
ncbi:hypothetical protein KBY85_15055 [Cyanobium sp. BA5m-10]|nr:hypothetical protein [Cyanobium sp. BA5m-10]